MAESLYERLGGAMRISLIVDDVVKAHMENPTIKARFLPYVEKPDTVREVKQHMCNFLGAGTGGPETYAGRSMPDTHRGMDISDAEYDAAVDDIMSTLQSHGIDEETRGDVKAMTDSLKAEIVHI